MDISGNNDRVIFGLGSIFGANAGNKYVTFADVLPWEDTQLAINELGTLINDLQKHGDYAIDKWS